MEVLRPQVLRGAGRRSVTARFRLLLAGLGLSLAAVAGAPGAPAEPSEFEIKAVFLFNFAQFVDWPSDAFSSPTSPLVIGVLGNDPFGSSLDEAVRGERVNDRPIVIMRYARVEDIAKCHILFVSESEAGQLERDLSRLKGRSILTVSDIEGFSHRGGMIRFLMVRNKVRLRINNDTARAAGLRISSKLLRPSEVVSSTR
jgi:YfiR/HmsC-like